MSLIKAGIASLSVLLAACATTSESVARDPGLEDMRAVSPALAYNTEHVLLGEVWKRPGLSPRDRSLVTVEVLIAKQQTVEMPYHFNLALENGVKPAELSEVINHLAFYTGWPNVFTAVPVVGQVFASRPKA